MREKHSNIYNEYYWKVRKHYKFKLDLQELLVNVSRN